MPVDKYADEHRPDTGASARIVPMNANSLSLVQCTSVYLEPIRPTS